MVEWTKERKKKFWHRCWFSSRGQVFGKQKIYYRGEPVDFGLYIYPPFTLDNLFNFAVPTLRTRYEEDKTLEILTDWIQEVILHYEVQQGNEALALAEAIEQALEQKDANKQR